MVGLYNGSKHIPSKNTSNIYKDMTFKLDGFRKIEVSLWIKYTLKRMNPK